MNVHMILDLLIAVTLGITRTGNVEVATTTIV